MGSFIDDVTRKYQKHKVNENRKAVVECIEGMIKQVNQMDISAHDKMVAVAFITQMKQTFSEPTVQYMLENKELIRAAAGSMLAKNGMIALRHHLSANDVAKEVCVQIIKAVIEDHNQAYVKFTPLEQSIQKIKLPHSAPSKTDDEENEISVRSKL